MSFSRILSYAVVLVLGIITGLLISTSIFDKKADLSLIADTSYPKPRIIGVPLQAGDSASTGSEENRELEEAPERPAWEGKAISAPLTGDSLSAPKYWKRIQLPDFDGAAFILITSWRDNHLYYQFSISPATESLISARNTPGSGVKGFTFGLYDRAGFKITGIHVPLYRMESIPGSGSGSLGIKANESVKMRREEYLLAVKWDVRSDY